MGRTWDIEENSCPTNIVPGNNPIKQLHPGLAWPAGSGFRTWQALFTIPYLTIPPPSAKLLENLRLQDEIA